MQMFLTKALLNSVNIYGTLPVKMMPVYIW